MRNASCASHISHLAFCISLNYSPEPRLCLPKSIFLRVADLFAHLGDGLDDLVALGEGLLKLHLRLGELALRVAVEA